jgi:maltose alpha-D-glucosyltransferase/alpha-amylase
MQWTAGPNKGFSTAPADKLYLPVDTDPNAPVVETQEKDPASLLNVVKALLHLRLAEPDLQAKPNLEILYAEKGKLPFIYRRGDFIVAVNPGAEPVKVPVLGVKKVGAVFALGHCELGQEICGMDGQSFGIWRG